MIELLKRPEGATVEQIAAATGWQKHTIRGAISGALKKKLGLNVEATRTREVGPNKTGAKGSSTVYRDRRLREPPMIIEPPRRRGYQLHAPDSPEAEALLTERGLTRADLDRALAELARTEGIAIRTSSASTTTACSAAAERAGGPTCPMPVPSPSSPCSGSRSWSCSGACPRAARPSSARTAPCPTDRPTRRPYAAAASGRRRSLRTRVRPLSAAILPLQITSQYWNPAPRATGRVRSLECN